MQGKTLQQVIDDAKAGRLPDPEVCRDTLLALHSMLVQSRMTLEIIADKIGNVDTLYYTTKAFLGNYDVVKMEYSTWMSAVPSEYLERMNNWRKDIESVCDKIESSRS